MSLKVLSVQRNNILEKLILLEEEAKTLPHHPYMSCVLSRLLASVYADELKEFADYVAKFKKHEEIN